MPSENKYRQYLSDDRYYSNYQPSAAEKAITYGTVAAGLITGGFFAYKKGLFKEPLHALITTLGKYRGNTISDASQGMNAWSKDINKDAAQYVQDEIGQKVLSEVGKYQDISVTQSIKDSLQTVRSAYTDLPGKVSESIAKGKEARAVKNDIIKDSPEFFRLLEQTNHVTGEVNKLKDQTGLEKRTEAIMHQTIIKDLLNVTKKEQDDLLKQTGFRFLTVGELAKLGDDYLSKGNRAQLDSLLFKYKDSAETILSKKVDPNILIDAANNIVDLRPIHNEFGDFIKTLSDNFHIPFIKINPLSMFYAKEFISSKTPTFHLLKPSSIQSFLTGDNMAIAEPLLYSNGKVRQLIPNAADPKWEFGKTIADDVYLTSSKEGTLARSSRKMAGPEVAEFRDIPDDASWFDRARGYMAKKLDIGRQEEPMGALSLTDPTTWLSKIAQMVFEKFPAHGGYAPKGQLRDAFGEETEFLVINKYKTLENAKSVGDWAGQFVAGRKNMKDVTTASFVPYIFFERLNATINMIGMGLSLESTGSAMDIFKNLMAKRAAPIIGAMAMWEYVNYETENLTGATPEQKLLDMYVNTSVDFANVKDTLGITDWAKHTSQIFSGTDQVTEIPGFGIFDLTKSAEETEKFWKEGETPVRKGRFWPLGNTSYTGGKVDYWQPNMARRAYSDWEYTDTLYGDKDEYWENAPFPTPRNPLCLIPGTSILLSNNSIDRIENVMPNKIVIGNDNNQHIVLANLQRPANEEATNIIVAGSAAYPITVTSTHPILAIKTSPCLRRCNKIKNKKERLCLPNKVSKICIKCQNKPWEKYSPQWISAGELEPGDVIVGPKFNLGDKQIIDLADFTIQASAITSEFIYPNRHQNVVEIIEYLEKQNNINGHKVTQICKNNNWTIEEFEATQQAIRSNSCVKRIPRYTEAIFDWGLFLGVYLAEGSIHSDKNVKLTLCIDELELANKLINIVKQTLGIKGYVRLRKDSNAISVFFNSRLLVDICTGLFGHGATTKYINETLFQYNKEFIKGILCGAFIGDGWNEDSGRTRLKTSSEELAIGIRNLLLALGLSPSLSLGNKGPGKTVILGIQCNVNQAYTIGISPNEVQMLFDRELIGWKNKSNSQSINPKYQWQDDQHSYAVILKTNKFWYEGQVYDIEVEQIHCFATPGGILHNSPIRHFVTDPYHYEKKHMEDRPYLITGPIPELAEMPVIGPLLSGTIGQILKPTEKMHPDVWEDLEQGRAVTGHKTLNPEEIARIESDLAVAEEITEAQQDDGVDYDEEAEFLEGERVAKLVSASGSTDASAVVLPVVPKRPNPLAVPIVPTVPNRVIQGEVVDPGGGTLASNGDTITNLKRIEDNISNIGGFYGFSMHTISGIKKIDYTKMIADSSAITSPRRQFWDANIGGYGGDLNEIGRRFTGDKEKLNKMYNPIPNKMPNWLPAEDYFINFHTGDAYTKVTSGETRLPGESYEALHPRTKAIVEEQLKNPQIQQLLDIGKITRGDLYDPISRLAILGDVAPWSQSYKDTSKFLSDSKLSGEDTLRVREIRAESKLKKKPMRLYPYRFKNSDIEFEKVTVDHVIDNNFIAIKEYPNPVKLAGIGVPNGKKSKEADEARQLIKQQIQPGSSIWIGVDKEDIVSKDTYQSIKAIVRTDHISNLNRELLRRGLAKEKPKDWTPAGIHARFTNTEIQAGKAWEWFAHRDDPFNTKFLQVRDPLESYKRRDLYGKDWQNWSNPVSDFLVPTFQSMMIKSPITGLAMGTLIGSLFGRTPYGKVVGAGIGFASVALGQINRMDYEYATGEKWIPGRRKKQREVEEYMDMLQYVKSKHLEKEYIDQAKAEGEDVEAILAKSKLENETRRETKRGLMDSKRLLKLQGDKAKSEVNKTLKDSGYEKLVTSDSEQLMKNINKELGELSKATQPVLKTEAAKKALQYGTQADSTMFGFEAGSNLQLAFKGLPKKERQYLPYFMKAPHEDREEILSLVPDGTKRVLQANWGMPVDPKPDIFKYFQDHSLPEPGWQGWNEESSLKNTKVKIVQNEALDSSEFDIWGEDEYAAQNDPTPAPRMNIKGIKDSTQGIRDRLLDLLGTAGFEDIDVEVQTNNTGQIDVDMDIQKDRSKDAQTMINKHAGNFI